MNTKREIMEKELQTTNHLNNNFIEVFNIVISQNMKKIKELEDENKKLNIFIQEQSKRDQKHTKIINNNCGVGVSNATIKGQAISNDNIEKANNVQVGKNATFN